MKPLFITHDCCLAGAQQSFLRLLSWSAEHTDWDIRVLALGDGPLSEEYAEYSPLLIMQGDLGDNQFKQLSDFLGGAPDIIFGNTVVSARCYPMVSGFHCPIVTRIAELDSSIEKYASHHTVDSLLKYCTDFVAVSSPVASMLSTKYKVPKERIVVINGAVTNTDTRGDLQKRSELLAEFGVAPEATILWGCGSISRRKGSDLFLRVAEELSLSGHDTFHAFWAGHPEDDLVRALFLAKERSLARHLVSFIGQTDLPNRLMMPGDIFLMTSREDPFPLVCLEAAERGVPSICFPKSGGIVDFVAKGGGVVAADQTPEAMAESVLQLLHAPHQIKKLGNRARELVLKTHTMATAGPQFAALFKKICTDRMQS